MADQYDVWLNNIVGLPAATAGKLLSRLGSAQAVYQMDPDQLGRQYGLVGNEVQRLNRRDLAQAREIIETCSRKGIRLLTLDDPDYPQRLGSIYDPPPLLYIRGQLPDFNRLPAIAVVGQRKCSPFGHLAAEKLAYGLARAGMVVVSGMAVGIDSAAHWGAIKGDSPTVAVFGTPVDGCYPASNAPLLREILRRGAVISEHPPGGQVFRSYFPRRNRIISGLCLGVVVAEAPIKSGSLITANWAVEQGRDVFAVPGNMDAPCFAGCNALIQSGAKLVTSSADILEEYVGLFPLLGRDKPERSPHPRVKAAEPIAAAYTPAGGGKVDQAVLSALNRPSQVDGIVTATGLTAPQVLAALTMLEVQGIVRQLPGQYYERV